MTTAPPSSDVPRGLRLSAGYAWRLLVIAAAVGVVVYAVSMVQLVAVSMFLAAVITAALRPLADLLDRIMPRALATVLAYVIALAGLGGIGIFITMSVSNQFQQLWNELLSGLGEIDAWIQRLPWRAEGFDLAQLGQSLQDWVENNQGTIVSAVVTRAGMAAEILTGVVLALFCSVFFVNSGRSMWQWFLDQIPKSARGRWHAGGSAAWHTFSGYVRGISLVAATNGLFCGIALSIMGIPLAAPIGLLVTMGTFLPYVGSAIALSTAVIVAFAAKGPWWALGVVALIVVIGQIEGHLLQPLIMAKQVKLHPVMVAVAVVAGALAAGLLGAVVAVPLVAVAWSVFDRLRAFDPDPGDLEVDVTAPS
ncbi:MAG: AI-2E family transporter [Micrococcales bacterium]|nr:AI-2E family transporter [Micrococcales bacterium]